MHSKKVSIVICLIIIILDLLLMAVYLQRQGEHTFGFIKSMYLRLAQEARFSAMRVPVFRRELWTVTMLTSML